MDKKPPFQQIGVLVTIPFVLAVPPIVGGFIGRWLDKHLGTTPYLMYVLIVLGMIAGGMECYRLVKEYGE
jgi:ATP synthase protein I